MSNGTSRIVNISMVTFNRMEFTKEAILSIAEHTSFPYVLTVVDRWEQLTERENT